MKTTTQIAKGILLWITVLSITLFIIGGFESLIEQGDSFTASFWFTVNMALFYVCYCKLTLKDVYVFSGSKWIANLLESKAQAPYHDDE